MQNKKKLVVNYSIIFIIFLILSKSIFASEMPDKYPNFKGEIITFDIKKYGLKAGEAKLEIVEPIDINSKQAPVIIFTAEALKFFDEEKIFLNKDSHLPERVERNVDFLGKKEVIREYYSKNKGFVRIIKEVGEKKEQQVIEKSNLLDNIYCFIYRYRKTGKFREGESFQINLPTKDVQMNFVGIEDLKIEGKKQKAYFLESIPKQYRIWFDTSALKIPLRIDGAVGFGSTSMIIKSYQRF